MSKLTYWAQRKEFTWVDIFHIHLTFTISFIGVKSQDKRVFMGLPSVLIILCFVLLTSCASTCVHSYSPGSCIHFRTILQDLARTVDQSSLRRRSKKVEFSMISTVKICASKPKICQASHTSFAKRLSIQSQRYRMCFPLVGMAVKGVP